MASFSSSTGVSSQPYGLQEFFLAHDLAHDQETTTGRRRSPRRSTRARVVSSSRDTAESSSWGHADLEVLAETDPQQPPQPQPAYKRRASRRTPSGTSRSSNDQRTKSPDSKITNHQCPPSPRSKMSQLATSDFSRLKRRRRRHLAHGGDDCGPPPATNPQSTSSSPPKEGSPAKKDNGTRHNPVLPRASGLTVVRSGASPSPLVVREKAPGMDSTRPPPPPPPSVILNRRHSTVSHVRRPEGRPEHCGGHSTVTRAKEPIEQQRRRRVMETRTADDNINSSALLYEGGATRSPPRRRHSIAVTHSRLEASVHRDRDGAPTKEPKDDRHPASQYHPAVPPRRRRRNTTATTSNSTLGCRQPGQEDCTLMATPSATTASAAASPQTIDKVVTNNTGPSDRAKPHLRSKKKPKASPVSLGTTGTSSASSRHTDSHPSATAVPPTKIKGSLNTATTSILKNCRPAGREDDSLSSLGSFSPTKIKTGRPPLSAPCTGKRIQETNRKRVEAVNRADGSSSYTSTSRGSTQDSKSTQFRKSALRRISWRSDDTPGSFRRALAKTTNRFYHPHSSPSTTTSHTDPLSKNQPTIAIATTSSNGRGSVRDNYNEDATPLGRLRTSIRRVSLVAFSRPNTGGRLDSSTDDLPNDASSISNLTTDSSVQDPPGHIGLRTDQQNQSEQTCTTRHSLVRRDSLKLSRTPPSTSDLLLDFDCALRATTAANAATKRNSNTTKPHRQVPGGLRRQLAFRDIQVQSSSPGATATSISSSSDGGDDREEDSPINRKSKSSRSPIPTAAILAAAPPAKILPRRSVSFSPGSTTRSSQRSPRPTRSGGLSRRTSMVPGEFNALGSSSVQKKKRVVHVRDQREGEAPPMPLKPRIVAQRLDHTGIINPIRRASPPVVIRS